MQKIELEFDELTLKRAQQLAGQQQTSLEEWLKNIISQWIAIKSSATLTAWEAEKAFIRQRMANASSTVPIERTWTREDIYDARLSG